MRNVIEVVFSESKVQLGIEFAYNIIPSLAAHLYIKNGTTKSALLLSRGQYWKANNL